MTFNPFIVNGYVSVWVQLYLHSLHQHQHKRVKNFSLISTDPNYCRCYTHNFKMTKALFAARYFTSEIDVGATKYRWRQYELHENERNDDNKNVNCLLSYLDNILKIHECISSRTWTNIVYSINNHNNYKSQIHINNSMIKYTSIKNIILKYKDEK